MKYICLVYVEEKVLNALPKTERKLLSDESMAYCDRLQKMGQLLAASSGTGTEKPRRPTGHSLKPRNNWADFS